MRQRDLLFLDLSTILTLFKQPYFSDGVLLNVQAKIDVNPFVVLLLAVVENLLQFICTFKIKCVNELASNQFLLAEIITEIKSVLYLS